MPKWGFEMCSHRWLDGLDDVLRMIGDEAFWPSPAGHCGDVPGRVVDAALARAAAVQAWIDGKETGGCISGWLGARSSEKETAARFFVAMVHTRFRDEGDVRPVVEQWREEAGANTILSPLLKDDRLQSVLENACGFKTVVWLDACIRAIGGDTEAADPIRTCNAQLRDVPGEDPQRYAVTRGYLWGLQAYLLGKDAGWLQAHRPDCAGAGIYALHAVSKAGQATPIRRWLAASLLVTTRLWCERAAGRMGHAAPDRADDLPDILETLGG